MKIRDVKVCMNMKGDAGCDEVVPHDAKSCPACTGTIFYPLASWVPPHNAAISIEELTRRSLSISDQICEMQSRMEEMLREVEKETVGA